jgi:hypothetical protein
MAASASDIELEEGPSKGRYVHRSPAGEGALSFSKVNDGLWILDHTETADGLRGQGVGAALVLRAVEDARAAGRRLIPLCTFAAAQFRRHPDWSDVLRR